MIEIDAITLTIVAAYMAYFFFILICVVVYDQFCKDRLPERILEGCQSV